MKDLLKRLDALRGSPGGESHTEVDFVTDDGFITDDGEGAGAARPTASHLDGALDQLGGRVERRPVGAHGLLERLYPGPVWHGDEQVRQGPVHPLLLRQARGAGGEQPGRIAFVDTETTGLGGGTGILSFLIGVGWHTGSGFQVTQLFLPGPEHERAQLEAFSELIAGTAMVVTYNGGSFDLPLLRNRFAMHGLPDPLAGVAHLDLLPVVRRLWGEDLPDCTLGTVERRLLGARRGLEDVSGAEVPARYLGYLRSRDPQGLRGVIEHNRADIVALSALRSRIERLIEHPEQAAPGTAHALAMWHERLGEDELALARYMQAARARPEAAWRASLLLKRLGRVEDAANLWFLLGRQGMSAAWIELAKAQEHRWRDYDGALASVAAAARCGDCRQDELGKRRERLLRRQRGQSA